MKKAQIYRLSSFKDERGSFSRVFDDVNHLSKNRKLRQVNISSNPRKFTLRGMHFQVGGEVEDKWIKVLSGTLYCVVTNAHLVSEQKEINNEYFSLSSNDNKILYVPSGLATGWLTLTESTTVLYLMSSRFEECEYGGFKYSDKWAKIVWPREPDVISNKDLNWKDLQ